VALKRATEADYHLASLLRVAPWLLQVRAHSRPELLLETVRAMRPLFAQAAAEHTALAAESGAQGYFRQEGWLKIYRSKASLEAVRPELALRLTTGAEFTLRDAPPSPVQLTRLLPAARALCPLAEPIGAQPWMGCRPCLPDSRPVIGRAPRHTGLWLAVGHAHWGLTLGPATGRMIAEMMTDAEPFCDHTPYRAERFAR
jgi:glycine/D-amino acid oxidase-like deaminating enzyme